MSCDIEATIDQRPINATIKGAIVNISGGAGGLIDGDYGDIAVSGAGTVWKIENMAETATVTTGTYVSNVNQALLIKARKASAGTITKGQVVYITGSSGTHLLVELARADAEATSAYAIGIAATTITNTTDGFVMQAGRLTGLSTLPTATYTNGQALYLSETTAGAYRVGIPTAPNHGVFLGFVVNASNGGAGVLDVRMQNYQELEELSDVYITGVAANNFLVRNATNTRWENKTTSDVKTTLNLSGTNTGDQNIFSTIAVSGQSNVVADSTSDTLTLVAGSNITITTNATNDEITIASAGGANLPTVTTLTNTTNTLTVGDISKIIRIDTTSNNVTATLPTAVGNTGYIFWIKRISGGSNTATIDTTSSQTIDGQSTAVLTVEYEAIGLYSNGTNWEII